MSFADIPVFINSQVISEDQCPPPKGTNYSVTLENVQELSLLCRPLAYQCIFLIMDLWVAVSYFQLCLKESSPNFVSNTCEFKQFN